MEEVEEIIDWQRLIITISIVLLTATVVGGAVWYLMDKNETSIADSSAKTIANMQKQIYLFEKECPINKSETDETTTPASN